MTKNKKLQINMKPNKRDSFNVKKTFLNQKKKQIMKI